MKIQLTRVVIAEIQPIRYELAEACCAPMEKALETGTIGKRLLVDMAFCPFCGEGVERLPLVERIIDTDA